MTTPQPSVRARIFVKGLVQGVAFRAFTADVAKHLSLKGGVQNLDDGRVLVEVEGEKKNIESLLESLRVGPPHAHVEGLEVEWGDPLGQWSDFQIWY